MEKSKLVLPANKWIDVLQEYITRAKIAELVYKAKHSENGFIGTFGDIDCYIEK